uniref:Uncharacterized protein LOC104231931 n=1 Tax=Nicotiana sylvestris TaxID=4096 RepID=A0A1U7XA23_NICSY|nr:PREDICTED: uncharacterized protein LOC104231931 [Nicotiana sylvestris]
MTIIVLHLFLVCKRLGIHSECYPKKKKIRRIHSKCAYSPFLPIFGYIYVNQKVISHLCDYPKGHLIFQNSILRSEVLKASFYSSANCVRGPGLENIKDEEDKEQLLSWWRERGKTSLTLSIMARDILTIQASSVASESAFSVVGFQIGDHRHSLADDSLEISVLLRYWINSERRNLGFEKLTTREKEEYNEILTTGSDDDMELMEHQSTLPIPAECPRDIINKLQRSCIGAYKY